jgi:hypothetical protein
MLHFDRTPHRVDHARKLSQQAVSGVLYNASAVLLDLRLDQLPQVRPQPLVRPLLIRPHEARIAGHIGG